MQKLKTNILQYASNRVISKLLSSRKWFLTVNVSPVNPSPPLLNPLAPRCSALPTAAHSLSHPANTTQPLQVPQLATACPREQQRLHLAHEEPAHDSSIQVGSSWRRPLLPLPLHRVFMVLLKEWERRLMLLFLCFLCRMLVSIGESFGVCDVFLFPLWISWKMIFFLITHYHPLVGTFIDLSFKYFFFLYFFSIISFSLTSFSLSYLPEKCTKGRYLVGRNLTQTSHMSQKVGLNF